MRLLFALVPVAFVLVAPSAFGSGPPVRVAENRAAGPAPSKAGAKKARRPKKKNNPPPLPQEDEALDLAATPSPAPIPPERAAAAAPAQTQARRTETADPEPTDVEQGPISLAPLVGFATTHANFGVGLRGGYTLPMRLYIGGSFVYHVGESAEIPTLGGTITTSVHLLYPGAEVGYEIPVGPVIIRPYGGVGVLVGLASTSGAGGEGGSSDSSSSLAFWPGCTGLYAIPSSKFFVGADTRVLIATSGDPSFGMFATGGMRF